MQLKQHLVKAALALAIGTSAQITIPNAGFETWTTAAGTNPDLPDGWKSFTTFPGIAKESSAHTGSYALKVSVAKYFTAAGSGDIRGGFSFSSITTAPLYFTFWAKVHIGGSDHLNITADLSKPPSTTIVTGIPYGRNVLSAADNTSVWTWFTFALETSPPPASDSASLRFTFSPGLDTSSNVIIDDLAFTDSKTEGLQAFAEGADAEPYSLSASGGREAFIYGLRENAQVSLTVRDMLGNTKATVFNGRQKQGKYKAELDIGKFADGVYLADLVVGGKSRVREFVVHN